MLQRVTALSANLRGTADAENSNHNKFNYTLLSAIAYIDHIFDHVHPKIITPLPISPNRENKMRVNLNKHKTSEYDIAEWFMF